MNDLEKQLTALSKKISKEVSGTLSVDDLFSNDFMEKNNILVSINDIFASANVAIEHISDLSLEEESRLDTIILQYSFESWSNFLQSAKVYYTKKKLCL